MGQNILGFCIVATIILMAMAFSAVRKDAAAKPAENLRLFGGLSAALLAEGAGYFLVS